MLKTGHSVLVLPLKQVLAESAVQRSEAAMATSAGFAIDVKSTRRVKLPRQTNFANFHIWGIIRYI